MQEASLESLTRVGDDGIVLRPLHSIAEFDEAVALQDEIWGAGFSDRVPAAILRVAQKVGGVSAAAFDPSGRMLGFVFGLTGIRDGQLVHWSDMLAVREEARGKRLGERLKLYQRDMVQAIGVEKMYWTFDPLVARNAHFNLNLLKAGIAEYAPNFYGSNTGSVLHGGLPTDRFVALWEFGRAESATPNDNSARTTAPSNEPTHPTIIQNGGVRIVDPLPDDAAVRVPVPSDIESVLNTNPDAALAWRLATRQALMHYLSRGYRIVAFRRGTDRELPAYELTRSPSRPV